jgi:1,4-dihydroxy-2-naphthoate octaprenyltransferase
MILAYILCFGVGLISLFFTSKLSTMTRFGIAISLAVVLAIALTLLLNKIGDRAPADATTVAPSSLEEKK